MSQSTETPLARVETEPRLREPQIVLAPARPAAAARRRQARASLLWAAAAVAAATLGLAVAVETVLPQLRDPEYGYRLARVRQLQREHPGRPLVLVVGTSRTQNAIDPEAMALPDRPGSPLVFNFGIAGAVPVRERLVLQRLLADGVRPAAVVVELFPATLPIHGPADYLFDDSAAKLAAGDPERLAPYLADPAALSRRWARERLNTWTAQQPVIAGHLVPNWQPWSMRIDHQWESLTAWGFAPYCGGLVDEKRGERRERMRHEHGKYLAKLRVSELSDRCYRDLVADCRAAGIAVAFLLTPESPAVRGWYAPESRAVLADYLRTLGGELGCPVFAAPDGFAEEDFADGIHMLAPAARRFSRELAEKHIRPWVEGLPK
jgi:hypothetical protein